MQLQERKSFGAQRHRLFQLVHLTASAHKCCILADPSQLNHVCLASFLLRWFIEMSILPRSQLQPFSRAIRRRLPQLNFIILHYAYFTCTILIGALIFWGSSTPSLSITFTDSLFLVASAMTEAGLNTINLWCGRGTRCHSLQRRRRWAVLRSHAGSR